MKDALRGVLLDTDDNEVEGVGIGIYLDYEKSKVRVHFHDGPFADYVVEVTPRQWREFAVRADQVSQDLSGFVARPR